MFFPNGCRALLEAWKLGRFIQWHTATPNAQGSNSYSANGARRLATGTLTTAAGASAGTATNAAAIESAAATAAWQRVTHLSIVSAVSGGVFQGFAPLGSPVTLAIGEKIRIAPGDLDISIPTS